MFSTWDTWQSHCNDAGKMLSFSNAIRSSVDREISESVDFSLSQPCLLNPSGQRIENRESRPETRIMTNPVYRIRHTIGTGFDTCFRVKIEDEYKRWRFDLMSFILL